jgi:hypothetical protein
MTSPVGCVRRHNNLWSAALVLCCAMAATAGSPSRAHAQALSSATSPDGKVRLEILSLKRTEGDTVTLRFQIVNESNDRFFVTIPNMRLIDIAGRRFYNPGIMSGSCSAQIGEKMPCYAVFAAPPPSTKTLTVQFYGNVGLITGVPISD